MTTGEAFVPSLETKAFGTPLLQFRGTLKEYISKPQKDDASGRSFMVIGFNFTDIEVIASTDPYAFPICTIDVGYSQTEVTRWGALAKSIKKLYGRTPALDEIVGKQQEWVYGPCKLRTKEGDQWKDIEDRAWQIVSIDGLGSPAQMTADIDAHVLDLLDGKTEQDFQQVFFVDPEIRKHPELIEQATNRQLLPTLEAAGRAYRDDGGVWHKGAKPD
jgi:hypothetical protein